MDTGRQQDHLLDGMTLYKRRAGKNPKPRENILSSAMGGNLTEALKFEDTIVLKVSAFV